MSILRVNELTKDYRVAETKEGVLGSIEGLFRRRYRTVRAVDSINFSLERGELVGYIGSNGAGKSTSIKMLTGILKPTSGEMEVLGFHPFRDRQRYTHHIGVVFGQRTQLWWDIAVIESFRLLGKIYSVPAEEHQRRVDRLSDILNLGELLRTPVRKLSLGQRMRCDLAASLLHNPSVLFLDEPTIGLDAVAKDSIRSFLRQINAEFGTTIILTTHDLKEIEQLCKRIIILDKGRVLYDGALAPVKTMPGLHRRVTIDFRGPQSEEQLQRDLPFTLQLEPESPRRISLSFDPGEIPAVDILQHFFQKYEIADLTVSEPSIEEVVMKIYREGMGSLPSGTGAALTGNG